ncbi:MAG: DNA internalization-related competence protein ComEC/Rec2 [Ruminococcaceae bacterium]|nr:DNA internalization-related competence protein ComEC/Rec2 [Oscillospiraceae bacterium]
MRKLMWFTVGFASASLIGALCYGIWLLAAAGMMLTVAGIFALISKKYISVRLIVVIAIGCAIGFGWFSFHDRTFVLLPRALDGKVLSVTIEATDYSYDSDYGSAVEGSFCFDGRNYPVKAYLRDFEKIEPGDSVTGSFRFRLTTDGGREEPTNHRTEGIFLLAYPMTDATVAKADTISWRHYPSVWRHHLSHRIQELFPGDSGAFASALLLGDRSGIDYELNTSFRASGISHVIAVSGLHVTILVTLLQTILLRRRLLSCLLGIPLLILFAAVIGFTPSVTRACIMQSLMLLAMVLKREYDPLTSLSFAALVMLVWNPLVILSVSFQLSVGCMLGIFLFSPHIRNWLQGLRYLQSGTGKGLANRIKRIVVTSVSVSTGAAIVTTPLVAYYFGCVSVVGVLTNLLVMWLISAVFYGVLLCVLLSTISMGLGAFFAFIVSLLIRFILKTAEFMAGIPMAAVYMTSAYMRVWLVGGYGMLMAMSLQRRTQYKLLLCGLAFTFLLSQTFSWIEPLDDQFRVTMFDVGQGQSILIQSEGKAFLVDCGGDNGKEAADKVADTLLMQGISRLDGIIVTHYDNDHVGGVEFLLSRIQTERLIVPHIEDDEGIGKALAEKADSGVEILSEDRIYACGQSKITVFAPFSFHSANESSLCVLFQRKDCDILITGDRGAEGEQELIQNHNLPDVELLVVGHHGSAGSTTEALLAATTPKIAFISVGEGNHYGHPSQQVLERLDSIGCEILRTDLCGTIIFRG